MRRSAITLALGLAGAALLAWQIRQVGLDDIREGFAEVGYAFLAVLAASFLRFVVRSAAWAALTSPPLPLRAALAATISGDALGNLTPLGLLASEPAKAMAVGDHVEPARALAALTVENFFYSVSVAIYVLLSTTALLAVYVVEDDVMWAGVASVSGMAVVLAGALWLAWKRPALVSSVVARVPIARVRGLTARIQAFEAQAYRATAERPGRLPLVIGAEVAFHALSLVECWLIFYLLTGETALLPAFILDGFNRVVNVAFKMIPGRLGVEEGGTGIVAAAIGYAHHQGFVLGLVRKARVFVWMAVGLIIFARARGRR